MIMKSKVEEGYLRWPEKMRLKLIDIVTSFEIERRAKVPLFSRKDKWRYVASQLPPEYRIKEKENGILKSLKFKRFRCGYQFNDILRLFKILRAQGKEPPIGRLTVKVWNKMEKFCNIIDTPVPALESRRSESPSHPPGFPLPCYKVLDPFIGDTQKVLSATVKQEIQAEEDLAPEFEFPKLLMNSTGSHIEELSTLASKPSEKPAVKDRRRRQSLGCIRYNLRRIKKKRPAKVKEITRSSVIKPATKKKSDLGASFPAWMDPVKLLKFAREDARRDHALSIVEVTPLACSSRETPHNRRPSFKEQLEEEPGEKVAAAEAEARRNRAVNIEKHLSYVHIPVIQETRYNWRASFTEQFAAEPGDNEVGAEARPEGLQAAPTPVINKRLEPTWCETFANFTKELSEKTIAAEDRGKMSPEIQGLFSNPVHNDPKQSDYYIKQSAYYARAGNSNIRPPVREELGSEDLGKIPRQMTASTRKRRKCYIQSDSDEEEPGEVAVQASRPDILAEPVLAPVENPIASSRQNGLAEVSSSSTELDDFAKQGSPEMQGPLVNQPGEENWTPCSGASDTETDERLQRNPTEFRAHPSQFNLRKESLTQPEVNTRLTASHETLKQKEKNLSASNECNELKETHFSTLKESSKQKEQSLSPSNELNQREERNPSTINESSKFQKEQSLSPSKEFNQRNVPCSNESLKQNSEHKSVATSDTELDPDMEALIANKSTGDSKPTYLIASDSEPESIEEEAATILTPTSPTGFPGPHSSDEHMQTGKDVHIRFQEVSSDEDNNVANDLNEVANDLNETEKDNTNDVYNDNIYIQIDSDSEKSEWRSASEPIQSPERLQTPEKSSEEEEPRPSPRRPVTSPLHVMGSTQKNRVSFRPRVRLRMLEGENDKAYNYVTPKPLSRSVSASSSDQMEHIRKNREGDVVRDFRRSSEELRIRSRARSPSPSPVSDDIETNGYGDAIREFRSPSGKLHVRFRARSPRQSPPFNDVQRNGYGHVARDVQSSSEEHPVRFRARSPRRSPPSNDFERNGKDDVVRDFGNFSYQQLPVRSRARNPRQSPAYIDLDTDVSSPDSLESDDEFQERSSCLDNTERDRLLKLIAQEFSELRSWFKHDAVPAARTYFCDQVESITRKYAMSRRKGKSTQGSRGIHSKQKGVVDEFSWQASVNAKIRAHFLDLRVQFADEFESRSEQLGYDILREYLPWPRYQRAQIMKPNLGKMKRSDSESF